MTISQDDLLSFAEALASETMEVQHRSAVSRAYYAAYHQSVAWATALPSAGISSPGSGVHKAHIDALTHPTVVGAQAMQSRSIGYMLGALKAERTRADYHLSETVDRHEATNAVERARLILSKAV